MRIILAEKPSLGREIEKALKQKGVGDFKVLSLRGHLVESNVKNNRWDIDGLPLKDEETIGLGFKVKAGDADIKKRVLAIKTAIFDSKTTGVYSAGDPDAEGSALVIQLLEQLGFVTLDSKNGEITSKKPLKRMIFRDLTTNTLLDSFNSAKDISSDLGLLYASKARNSADSIVGFNLTRLYGLMYGNYGEKLSVGRVQTPTLSIVREREIEIENFKSKNLYKIKVDTSIGQFIFQGELDENTYKTKAPKKGDFLTIGGIDKAIKTLNPQPPVENNDLLIYGSKKLKWKPEKTSQIMQEMYEAKNMSYPRTESGYIPDTEHQKVIDIIKNNNFDKGYKLNTSKTNKNIFRKPEEVGAHYGILPQTPPPASKRDQNLLFDYIKARFIMSMMEANKVKQYKIIGQDSSKGKYLFSGNKTEVLGFKEYESGKYTDKTTEVRDVGELDQIKKGDKIEILKVSSEVTKTKPPTLIKNADLLKKMKSIKIAGKNGNETTSSIGTPATRSGIVTQLINTGKLKDSEKGLTTTDLGKKIYSKTSSVMNLQITAMLDTHTKEIEREPKTAFSKKNDFIKEVKVWVNNIIKEEKKGNSKKIEELKAKSQGVTSIKRAKTGVLSEFKYQGGVKTAYKTLIGKTEHIIWGDFMGKKITKKIASDLLIDKKELELDGLKSKKGNEFSAKVKYDLKQKKIVMRFK
jgi:DNA topoisomerase-3